LAAGCLPPSSASLGLRLGAASAFAAGFSSAGFASALLRLLHLGLRGRLAGQEPTSVTSSLVSSWRCPAAPVAFFGSEAAPWAPQVLGDHRLDLRLLGSLAYLSFSPVHDRAQTDLGAWSRRVLDHQDGALLGAVLRRYRYGS
jgi:hypothetical protein